MNLDEMTAEDGSVRRPYARVAEWLTTVSPEQLERRRVEAELFYRRGGITFAVYGDAQGEERIIPYDIIPRMPVMPDTGAMARNARTKRAGEQW